MVDVERDGMAGTPWDRLLKLEEARARKVGKPFNALLGAGSAPGFWRREGAEAAVAPINRPASIVPYAPYKNWEPKSLPPGGSDRADSEGWRPPAPPGVSLEANIAEAKRHRGDLLWFYNKVKRRAPWDYKWQGKRYEPFGNFLYGAAGRAADIPEVLLERMPGFVQDNPSKLDLSNPLGRKPYGDDPFDQIMSKDGMSWEDRRERK
jgi:hypothetical protein